MIKHQEYEIQRTTAKYLDEQHVLDASQSYGK
jgi:hypothetical protein